MEFPVGPKTVAKASKTESGKLAKLLNRLLYSADYGLAKEKGTGWNLRMQLRRFRFGLISGWTNNPTLIRCLNAMWKSER